MTDNVIDLRPPAPQPLPSSPEANVHRLAALGLNSIADTSDAMVKKLTAALADACARVADLTTMLATETASAANQRAMAAAMNAFADAIEQERNSPGPPPGEGAPVPSPLTAPSPRPGSGNQVCPGGLAS